MELRDMTPGLEPEIVELLAHALVNDLRRRQSREKGDANGWDHQTHLAQRPAQGQTGDRKSTRLNSSHGYISYAVFCLKKKKKNKDQTETNSIIHQLSVNNRQNTNGT